MPNIRAYESPIEGLNPSDRGADAAAMAGRRVGAFYHQEGEALGGAIRTAGADVDRFVAHQEVSHYNLAAAGKMAEWTQQWNQLAATSDPNDPTVAKKFMSEVVEPGLQKLQDGQLTETGQRYSQAHAEGMRQHFAEKSAADMSTLAGVAVTTNLDKIGNTYSGVAFNDPSATKENLRQYDAAVESTIATSNLTAEGVAHVRAHAQAVKEQIAKEGLSGLISKNPNVDYSKFAADPAIAPYLKGSDPAQLQQYQRGQQRIQRSLDNQEKADQRRQQTEANDDSMNKILHDHSSVDASGNLRVDAGYFAAIREASTRAGLRPGLLNEMLNMGDHISQNAGKIEDDPATKTALQQEIVNQDEDFTRHLVKAAADDKISGRTFAELHAMSMAVQHDPESVTGLKDVFTAARATIVNPLLPGQKDARGEMLYSDFVNEVGPQLAKMNAQERKLQSNFSDPASIVSRTLASPKYNRTPQDRLRDLMNAQGLSAAPDAATSRAGAIPANQAAQPLKPGAVVRGYKFLGGDAAKPASWEQVK